jgi:TetR/AcrR family transcriptional repressor of uid operon
VQDILLADTPERRIIMKKAKCEPEVTCQALIDAAYSLFVEKGFHATSMREIAKQAGVSLGNIYNYFDSTFAP